MSHFLQEKPLIIPTTDGKLIEEHFGLAVTNNKNISIAHMIAPPGWDEPFQNPEFDEWTIVFRGKKMIEVDGKELILEAGRSLWIGKGSRVRYSNPFQEECEYWSVCMPAFSIDTVNREA